MSQNNPETQARLTHPKYRADIDGLRAIAVLAVVGFHAFPAWVKGGFIGVDVFFVISGFLISTIMFGSLERNRFSFLEFYSRRIRRIFPALIVVLVASLLFGWLFLLADEYQQLGKHIAGGAAFVANFVLWNESGYFDNIAETKPLLHLWSLGIEEQFYLIYPLALWAAWKRKLSLLSITTAIAVASFAANIFHYQSNPLADFYSPYTRFWELMAGSIAAYWRLHRQRPDMRSAAAALSPLTGSRAQNAGAAVGVVLLLAGLILTDVEMGFPGWWALLPVIGTVLLLLAGSGAWINRQLLSSRVLVWIGLISYPLYLWHWVLLTFSRIVESQPLAPQITLALIALSFALAWITYEVVERALRFGGHGNWKALALALAMGTCAMSGFAVYVERGLSFRSANQFPHSTDVSVNRLAAKLREDPAYLDVLQADRQVAIRAPYCHMNEPDQPFAEFAQGLGNCMRLSSTLPNVLILGDSHAADLYAALSYAMSDRYNFLQATGAGCFPDRFYGQTSDTCSDLLRYAISFSKSRRLTAIVLASRWLQPDYKKLQALLTELKMINTHLYVVSPPASFTGDIIKILRRNAGGSSQREISRKYLDQETLQENARLKLLAAANGVQYIDRIDLFCGPELLCPIVSPQGDLYFRDYGHLGRVGAQYLGSRFVAAKIGFD